MVLKKNIFKFSCLRTFLLPLIGFCFYVCFVNQGYGLEAEKGVACGQQDRFSQAKRLAKKIYADHRTTFYCGCHYDKHGKIDLRSCGYRIQHNKRRAHRLEWEHIVPVSLWGNHLPCWKETLCCKKHYCYKGRPCCRKLDPSFAKMEADLHNIVPEIGELNALRSHYRFGVLPHIESAQFGPCEIKIDTQTRRVEPPPRARGMIARAYLYMAETYAISLSKSQIQLFMHWNRQYPPESWEIERNKRIQNIQGNDNSYITQYQDKIR
jgi:deoxyribonuclease-1